MRKPYEEETTYVPGGLTHEENERALRLRIEELCTEFEDNWQPDSVELIQDAAAQIPERLDAILRELIVLDCELLSEHGTEPHLDRYQSLPAAWQKCIHSAFEDSKNSEDGSIASDDPPGIPERIGDYQILREIGRGGMGVIYEAVQESLGRRVAIKTLANMHVSRLAPRFEREARAVARLHHTNIIEVYGTGIHDGVPYFAMQLVEGKSLSEAIMIEIRRSRFGIHRSLLKSLDARFRYPHHWGSQSRAGCITAGSYFVVLGSAADEPPI